MTRLVFILVCKMYTIPGMPMTPRKELLLPKCAQGVQRASKKVNWFGSNAIPLMHIKGLNV